MVPGFHERVRYAAPYNLYMVVMTAYINGIRVSSNSVFDLV